MISIAIESAEFDLRSGTVTVFAKNLGRESSLETATFYGSPDNKGYKETINLDVSQLNLAPGEVARITSTLPSLAFGDVLTIKVTAPASSIAAATFSASQGRIYP